MRALLILLLLARTLCAGMEGWTCQAALDQLNELDSAVAAFLRPVLTGPDDLVARARYGDWLAERGSPLGDVLLANTQLHAIRLQREGDPTKADEIWEGFGKSGEAEKALEARRDELLAAWFESLREEGGEPLVLAKLAAAFPDVDPRSVQFVPVKRDTNPFDLADLPPSLEVIEYKQTSPVTQWMATTLGESSDHQAVLGNPHDPNGPLSLGGNPFSTIKSIPRRLDELDSHFRYRSIVFWIPPTERGRDLDLSADLMGLRLIREPRVRELP